MGFSFNVFLNANKISPSGFSGLSAILSSLLQNQFGISIHPSIIYLSINAVLFVIAFKSMGLNFAINAALGIVSYSLFLEFCNFDLGLSGSESELLLYAIYGGVIMGAGLGFVFRGNGSTGGSDMLASILHKKARFLTIGNIVFIVDTLVVFLSFIVYKDLKLAMYSLIAIWIMTKVSDTIVSGVQGVRGYYIISNKYEEIAKVIMNDLQRGVTGYNAEGMYTHNAEKVIMTLVTRSESIKLRQIVSSIDKDAFMFSCPVSEAMGMGFMPIKTEKKKKVHKKKTKIENAENNNFPNKVNKKELNI